MNKISSDWSPLKLLIFGQAYYLIKLCENQVFRLRYFIAAALLSWLELWAIAQIFIYSLRDIKDGEELTFDYGFDIECYQDHPCLCGRPCCVGYIVSREQWPKLKEKLEGQEETESEQELQQQIEA